VAKSLAKCRVIFLRVNYNLRNDNALALSLAARGDYTFDIWKSFHLFTGGDYTYRVPIIALGMKTVLRRKFHSAETREESRGVAREIGKPRSIFAHEIRKYSLCSKHLFPSSRLRGIFNQSNLNVPKCSLDQQSSGTRSLF